MICETNSLLILLILFSSSQNPPCSVWGGMCFYWILAWHFWE